jgi:hypothetical protein
MTNVKKFANFVSSADDADDTPAGRTTHHTAASVKGYTNVPDQALPIVDW